MTDKCGFLLNNLKFRKTLEIKKENNKNILIVEESNIQQIGRENVVPYNIFLLEDKKDNETNDDKKLKIDGKEYSAIILKNIEFKTVIKGEAIREFKDCSIDEVNLEFGTKQRRKMILKRDIDGFGIKDDRKIDTFMKDMDIETVEQVLPEVQGDKFYVLEKIFEPSLINSLKKLDFRIENAHPHIQHIKELYRRGNKVEFILLDNFLKVLDKKIIIFDSLKLESKYINRRFLKIVENNIEKKKLTPIGRDKFIIYVYILLLFITNFKVNRNIIPTFKMDDKRVNSFFFTLGCGLVKKNNTFVLEREPRRKVFSGSKFRNR